MGRALRCSSPCSPPRRRLGRRRRRRRLAASSWPSGRHSSSTKDNGLRPPSAPETNRIRSPGADGRVGITLRDDRDFDRAADDDRDQSLRLRAVRQPVLRPRSYGMVAYVSGRIAKLRQTPCASKRRRIIACAAPPRDRGRAVTRWLACSSCLARVALARADRAVSDRRGRPVTVVLLADPRLRSAARSSRVPRGRHGRSVRRSRRHDGRGPAGPSPAATLEAAAIDKQFG